MTRDLCASHVRKVRGVVSVLAAVLACVGLCVPSAMASDGVDWRVDGMGVRDAWASGITGKGVKVAVLDNQIVSDYPSLAGTDVSYKLVTEGGQPCYLETGDGSVSSEPVSTDDPTVLSSSGYMMTHGTHMVSLIAGNGSGWDGGSGIQGIASGASVIAYMLDADSKGNLGELNMPLACKTQNNESTVQTIGPSVRDAVDSGARIINMSFGYGDVSDAIFRDYMLYALRHGVVMVSGRSNGSWAGLYDLVGAPGTTDYFPGVVTVNAVDSVGNLQESSDVMDGNVSVLSPGVGVPSYRSTDSREMDLTGGGTSTAAANLSAYLALVMQKWPDATGNQILQSLIRNTKGNASSGPKLDPEHKRGFGIVDPGKLLSVDPAQYPDVNPLLEWAVKTSGEHEETKGMYEYPSPLGEHGVADTGEFSPDGDTVMYTPDTALVGRELQRQQAAWEKVESCRADGGSDCMKYSATATADEEDGKVAGDMASDASGSSVVPSWVVPVVLAGAGVLVLAGVVLAVVLARGMRRARDAGRAVPAGPVGGSGVPPVPYGVAPSYGGPAARSAPVAGSYPNAGVPAGYAYPPTQAPKPDLQQVSPYQGGTRQVPAYPVPPSSVRAGGSQGFGSGVSAGSGSSVSGSGSYGSVGFGGR